MRRDLPFFGVEEGGGLVKEGDPGPEASTLAHVTSYLLDSWSSSPTRALGWGPATRLREGLS
jgi:hypothetical protein